MSVTEPPYRSAVINALQRAEDVWLKWFALLKQAINRSAQVVGVVSLSGQGASIAATTISTPTLTAGVYQITMAHRVTRADNTGSSLTPYVTVTESGLTVTYTGAANTSNNVLTGKSDQFTVVIDASTPIKFGTSYSTAGGVPSMLYRLTVRLAQVPEAA